MKILEHAPDKSLYHKGCRCDLCKAAHSLSAQISNRARLNASKWVREYRADIWQNCIDDAYEYFGKKRQPVGEPPNPNSWMADYNRDDRWGDM